MVSTLLETASGVTLEEIRAKAGAPVEIVETQATAA
jgi:hypothetical protein